MFDWVFHALLTVNPLRDNPTKRSNSLKQFVGNLPTNCLSVFDHFAGLALKGLSYTNNQVDQLFQLPGLQTNLRIKYKQKQFFTLPIGTLKYFMKIFTQASLFDSGYSEMNGSKSTIWLKANVTHVHKEAEYSEAAVGWCF